MTSLKQKTISGIFWSLMQNVGGKGITFIVTIILARLLTPEIFGLIGMLMIFIQVSQTLVVAGFNQALIQKKNTDEEDYSSVFWINLVVSVLVFLTVFFGAPWIADFYDKPILILLARVISVVFIINAFSYVQEARLSKEMRFKTLTIISIPSTVIGGVVSIGMALMDYGVWAIIALQLTTRLAYTIQLWIYAKWKPLWVYNPKKVRDLFSFGSKLMISGVINTIYQNIYLVVIGKYFPVASVGYYQHSNNLVRTPTLTFSGALIKVTFPAFSSIQNDDKLLRQGFKKIIQQVLFWLCPILILAIVLAVPLFRLIFTEKWLPAVPYFQILCISGIFLPLHSFNLNILNVKGQSTLYLKLEIFKKLIITLGIILTLPFGIFALIIFQASNSVLMYIVNAYFSGKSINYPVLKQLKDIYPILLISLFTGSLVYFIDFLILNLNDLVRLIVGFFAGILVYWIIVSKIKLEPYIEFKYIFQTSIKKTKI